MTPLWTGPAVALVTLFDEDGSVAVDRTAAHAAQVVALGIPAVLVNGSTGEAATLDDDERVAVVAAVRRACPDVPVLSGASGPWWRPATERVRAAVAAGADGLLVAPPLAAEHLEDYFVHVAGAAGDVPVLAYHWPGVAGGEVPVEALPELPVAGIKDSSGDATRLVREVATGWPGAIYTGSPALLSYARFLGAAGAIVAAANVVPELCLAAWAGELQAQRDVVVADHAMAERVPRDLKEAMARRFGTPVTCRAG